MGIAERDYSRQPPGRGMGSDVRVGRMRAMSVNTWIIVINVVVFLVGNLLLGNLMYKTTTGRFTVPNVTVAELDRGRVERRITLPYPGVANFFFHPIYDPTTAARTQDGRVILQLDGTPEPRLLGGERFTFMPAVRAFGHFSTGKVFVDGQIWRLLTFQFLHADDFTHIVFNMMGLWFVGGLVEEYLGRRRYLLFYLTCGVCGAVMYLVLNLLGFFVFNQWAPGMKENPAIPLLLFDDIYQTLVGASAGVFGVLMAAAFIAPNAIVDVAFIIPMKMRTAVYIFLGVAGLNLFRGGANAGGDAAHVGGAIAGAVLIRQAHVLWDCFGLLRDSRTPRPGKRKGPGATEALSVDGILKKAQVSGLESLTSGEREIMRREREAAGERYAD